MSKPTMIAAVLTFFALQTAAVQFIAVEGDPYLAEWILQSIFLPLLCTTLICAAIDRLGAR